MITIPRLTAALLSCAILLTAGPVQSARPWSMTLVTASPGGVYAIYGEGLAGIITDQVGIPTSTRQTQGPNQNLVLVNFGRVDLGMTTTGPAYEAWTGVSELIPGVTLTNVRALIPMYPTPFQMIALTSSGIASIAGLQNKTLGAGPRAGTGGTYWPRWLSALGVSADYRFGPIGDQAAQLADGRLDAIVLAGGIPHPSMTELNATQTVTIFGLSEKSLSMIAATAPYVVPFTIPAATYDALDSDQKTAAMWNFVIAHKDMPEDLAYEIVAAVFSNRDRLLRTHAAARDTRPENAVHNTVIPFHPGAVRYYREHGIPLSDPGDGSNIAG